MTSRVQNPSTRRSFFLRMMIAAVATCVIAPPSTAATTESSPRPTILVVGDSISAEYGLQRDTGWVKLLDARLREQHYDYAIVNASISGETTSGGLSRIDELVTRVKPAIVIVELGGNDALRGMQLDQSQKNLDAIVARAHGTKAGVLIVGMQIPPNYGKAYGDRFAAMYTAVAKRYDAALTPAFFAGFADQMALFQADGIHPTAAAQGRLLDNVWPDLKPLLKRR